MLSTSADLSGSRAVCPPEDARMGVGPGPSPRALCVSAWGRSRASGLCLSLSTLSQPVPGLRAEELLLCLRGGP